MTHIMANRLLGNGGAIPPSSTVEHDAVGPLDSLEVSQHNSMLWLIVLIMNIFIVGVIPCISILLQKINERRQRINGSLDSQTQGKLKRDQYLQHFQNSKVVFQVKEENLVVGPKDGEPDVECGYDEEDQDGTLTISTKKDDGDGGSCESNLVAPIACAICLDSYQTGDTVVWSTNSECTHVFHQDCIIDFFTTKKGDNADSPCPCCRRQFCDASEERPNDHKEKSRLRNW